MSGSLDYAAERQRIKSTLFPSYKVPLKQVKAWVRRTAADARASLDILRDLRHRYPFAMDVGDELAFALLQAGDIEGAKLELKQLEKEFGSQLSEEIICRLGRIHRDIGNAFAIPERSGPPEYHRALVEYQLAWEQYDRAYALRAGHYPGINCAWLDLLKAWVTSDRQQRTNLLGQARATAQHLLDNRDKWPKDQQDDEIWHAGTAGDANLIVGNVVTARACYQSALELADEDFYKITIGKMVKAARPALQEVGGIPENELESIVKLFE